MADITKCSGVGCSMKNNCHRYTAKSGVWQSMFVSPPIKDGKCDMYWGTSQNIIMNQLNDILNGNGK